MTTFFSKSLLATACILTAYPNISVSAAITPEIPRTLIYEGRLLSKTSQKLEGDYTLRFSLWKTTDIQDDEIDATTGELNINDPDFGNWTEEISIQFTDQGYFSAILGEQQAFTDILLTDHKYLQVEIKKGLPTDDNDEDYQVLDVDVLDDEKDRKLISSLPYAFNAEESNTAKTAEGSVGNVFVIDPDNTVETAETGEIQLKFGEMLAKIIAYNYDRSLFTINDSVEITGDLSLASDTGSITFSPENSIGNNTYILPDSDESVADASIDETFILVDTKTTQTLENKTIDASLNNITNLDISSLQSSPKHITITPQYPNTTFEANTTQNQVSVFMGNEEMLGTTVQYYKISTDTTDNTLHTGKFITTINLEEFSEFDTNNGKIMLHFKTTNSDSTKNKIDISVSDSEGNIFTTVQDNTSDNQWSIIEIDLSSIDISNSIIQTDHSIQLEIDAFTSTDSTVFISNIIAHYKGK